MDIKDFNSEEVEKLLNYLPEKASQEDELHRDVMVLFCRIRASKLGGSKHEEVKIPLTPNERHILGIAFEQAVARWTHSPNIKVEDFKDKSQNAREFITFVIDDLYEGIKFFEAVPDSLISQDIKKKSLFDLMAYLQTGEYRDEYEVTILPLLALCIKKSSDNRKGII